MESLNFQAISYSPVSSTLDLYEILNYVQFSPYIILTTIGILAILWFTLHEDRVKLLGIIGLGLLALSIPNPLFSIPNIFTKLIFNRFMEYTSVFIIITVSFGLFYIFNKLNTKMKIIFMSLIFVTCLLSIENDFTATDNPLFKRPFYTFYFNTPEMGSIDTLLKISKNSYLMSDYVMTRYIWHYFDRGHLLEIDYSGSKFFKERDIDLIIIRESELQKRPLQLFVTPEFVNNPAWSEGDFIYFNYDAKVFENVNIYNRSYDNGYVITYN
jgi:hypothetical protein